MSQAMPDPVSMERKRWEAGGLESAHVEALQRPSRRRTAGAYRGVGDAPYDGDLHLLDGRGWWHPWAGGLVCVAVPAMLKGIPGSPWWEFLPVFVALAIGLGVVYVGWKVGNPVQRACCVCLAVAMMGLGAKVGDWAIGAHIYNGSLQQMDAAYEL